MAAVVSLSEKVLSAKSIICDIEGTTTSISFVKDTLFPYALKNVEEYLKNNWNEEATKTVVVALREQAEEDKKGEVEGVVTIPAGDSEDIIPEIVKNVEWQMSLDRKTGSLKTLQGLVWAKGYKDGSIKGHVYDDVQKAFERWTENGRKIYIYSSGSVDAQKLLFGHSEQGDLLKFLSGHYDTKVGAKREKESYTSILKNIESSPEEALFLTDVYAEAKAAKDAGLNVVLLDRPGNSALSEEERKEFPVIGTFSDLSFAETKEENGAATNGKRKIEETNDVAEEDQAQEQPPSKVVKVEENKKIESAENGTTDEKDTVKSPVESASLPDKAETMEVDGEEVAKKIESKEEKDVEKMEEDTEKVADDDKKDTKDKAEVMDTDKNEQVVENKKPNVENSEPEKEQKEEANEKKKDVEQGEKKAEKEDKVDEKDEKVLEKEEKVIENVDKAEKEEMKEEKAVKATETVEKDEEKDQKIIEKDEKEVAKEEKTLEKEESSTKESTTSDSKEEVASSKTTDEKDGEKKEEIKDMDTKTAEQSTDEEKPEEKNTAEKETEKSPEDVKAETATTSPELTEAVVDDKKDNEKTTVDSAISDTGAESKVVEVTKGVEAKSDGVVDEVAAEAKEDAKVQENAKPSNDAVDTEKTNGSENVSVKTDGVEQESTRPKEDEGSAVETKEHNGSATKSSTNGSSMGEEEKNGDSDKENDTSLSNCETDETTAEKTNGTAATPAESTSAEEVTSSEIKAKKVIEPVTPAVTPAPPIEAES